jgi:hypothetical protein
VWNNLHITADIVFRPTMTHVVISLRRQLDIQRQALRHDARKGGGTVACALVASAYMCVCVPLADVACATVRIRRKRKCWTGSEAVVSCGASKGMEESLFFRFVVFRGICVRNQPYISRCDLYKVSFETGVNLLRCR